MKAVILAGGRGSRMSAESDLRPKPMVAIGGRPMLWHIMKIYAHHGITDFIVCLGYKGYAIKEYFANYLLHSADDVVSGNLKRIYMASPELIDLMPTSDSIKIQDGEGNSVFV